MLPGRESLVRLIGKRRGYLSPNLSQLLHPQNLSPARPEDAISGEEKKPSSSKKDELTPTNDGNESYNVEWVSCPVCGNSIRGTDYCVNSHLDTCLTRGTKRKLTQRTLLHFSFSPKSRTDHSLSDPDHADENIMDAELIVKDVPSDIFLLSKNNSVGSIEGRSTLDSPHNSPSILKACDKAQLCEASLEIIEGAVNDRVDTCRSHMVHETTKVAITDAFGAKIENSRLSLETFIVGRRFHDNVKLQQGASIVVLRETQNSKDRHAIKGFVVAVPKQPFDIVPIQLKCQRSLDGEFKSNDQKVFESLWENVLVTIENGKMQPPIITKYQMNFCLMIKEVMSNHAHLFTDKEKSFIGSFNSLSGDAQRLFIRLYSRKGPWFRMSNILYTEISDPLLGIEELQVAGYIYLLCDTEDPFGYDIEEVLDLLSISELRELLRMELPKEGIKCTRRKELVAVLFSAYKNGKCQLLPKITLGRTGTCVRISSTSDEVLWRIQRLFFLNGEQDLSSFLLVNLGLMKFPDYMSHVSHQIFQRRSNFLEYEEAIQVAQIMDESLDDNNMEMVSRCISLSDTRMGTISIEQAPLTSESRPTFFSVFSAAWVYSKVLTVGVSVYEREHRYEDAIRLLKSLLSRITSDNRRGYWTLRLSVDLEHMGHFNESLSVAEKGVLDPWVRAGSKIAVQKRAVRLSKPPRRWRTPSYADSINKKIKEVNVRGRPLNCEVGVKNLFYGYDGEICRVEQLALQYYAEEGGWQGVHSESGIWMTIFGLLMWDVIFSNVPDVFRSKFQIAPLDLDTDDFYESRKSLIESHLKRIYEGMAEEILITSWDLHVGTTCRGVNWERHPLSDLRAVVSCIGGRCLASLCRHLSLDYRSWSTGMPDLLLWRFHKESSNGEAKLVEVKGPRDRLSEQQRAWMLVLMDSGFNTEVCKILFARSEAKYWSST
ncbi:fanconi-associated nuclease 1 homolog isoform X2 [Typha latifolia]|uniref:fanconi-associated nuclease 1 homolog isoform X2 n=1 Tax=Typha latifolia TaxID=4733 RepID=UPI003C2E2376